MIYLKNQSQLKTSLSNYFDNQALFSSFHSLTLQGRVTLAYSGGVDSHALLHVLATLRAENPHFSLRAVHVNHGLNKDAQQWSQHCAQICQNLGVEFVVCHIDPQSYANPQEGIEATARKLRYQLLEETLSAGEFLFTAHNQNDQAETVLLQLLRGSGIKGLAAMPKQKALGKGWLIRPWLDVTRQEIIEYAKIKNLHWIEDSSNTNPRFERNALRKHIMPRLKKRWVSLESTLSRTARHCAESADLLEELAAQDLDFAKGEKINTLSIPALKQLSFPRQKNLLRHWLRQLNLEIPNTKRLEQLCHDFIHSTEDATPFLCFQETEIRRYGGELYAFSLLPPHNPHQIISWDLKNSLILPANLGVLTTDILYDAGLSPPEDQPVTIRFRQGGERIKLPQHMKSYALKKLFQTWRIPPWQRNRIPLIYFGENLVWVLCSIFSYPRRVD